MPEIAPRRRTNVPPLVVPEQVRRRDLPAAASGEILYQYQPDAQPAKPGSPPAITDAMRQESLAKAGGRRKRYEEIAALGPDITEEQLKQKLAEFAEQDSRRADQQQVSNLQQEIRRPTEEERLATQVRAQLKERITAIDEEINRLDQEISAMTGGKSADEVQNAVEGAWGGVKRFFRSAFKPELQKKLDERKVLLRSSLDLSEKWGLDSGTAQKVSIGLEARARTLRDRQTHLEAESKARYPLEPTTKDSKARRQRKTELRSDAFAEAWFDSYGKGETTAQDVINETIMPETPEEEWARNPLMQRAERNLGRAEQKAVRREMAGKKAVEEIDTSSLTQRAETFHAAVEKQRAEAAAKAARAEERQRARDATRAQAEEEQWTKTIAEAKLRAQREDEERIKAEAAEAGNRAEELKSIAEYKQKQAEKREEARRQRMEAKEQQRLEAEQKVKQEREDRDKQQKEFDARIAKENADMLARIAAERAEEAARIAKPLEEDFRGMQAAVAEGRRKRSPIEKGWHDVKERQQEARLRKLLSEIVASLPQEEAPATKPLSLRQRRGRPQPPEAAT